MPTSAPRRNIEGPLSRFASRRRCRAGAGAAAAGRWRDAAGRYVLRRDRSHTRGWRPWWTPWTYVRRMSSAVPTSISRDWRAGPARSLSRPRFFVRNPD